MHHQVKEMKNKQNYQQRINSPPQRKLTFWEMAAYHLPLNHQCPHGSISFKAGEIPVFNFNSRCFLRKIL
jgi:hypothetical protein